MLIGNAGTNKTQYENSCSTFQERLGQLIEILRGRQYRAQFSPANMLMMMFS